MGVVLMFGLCGSFASIYRCSALEGRVGVHQPDGPGKWIGPACCWTFVRQL